MFQKLKGFGQFISVERGLMLFMISLGSAFLISESLVWSSGLILGIIVFCIWSAVDSINNFFDVDVDVLSDPFRSEYTRKLGKLGLVIAVGFTVMSLALGAATRIIYVVIVIGIGIMFGVLYSAPPFRLRQTVYKPAVNFTVGAVPVLIVATFFNVFSFNTMVLVLLIGVTTAVNSLWEDLADFASDFDSGSRTIPIILGFRRGLLFTIIMGYSLIPLMVLVGMLFQLGLLYYLVLLALASFISLRLYQKRLILFDDKTDKKNLFELGEVLSRDFVITAIVFTLSLMLSSLLKNSRILF